MDSRDRRCVAVVDGVRGAVRHITKKEKDTKGAKLS
jgi:hypothetical protein